MRIVTKVSLSDEEAEFDVKSLTTDQMKDLLKYYKTCQEPRRKEFLEMFFFAFHACGLRVVDVMTLQWSHINFDKKEHKNFGTETQLPPFHSSEAEQGNSIRQIMEHVDSRNELSQEVQILQSIIETLKEVSEKIDKDKAGLRVVVDVMDQVHAMLSCETEGLFDLQKQVRRQVVEMCQKSVPLSLPDDVGAKPNTIARTPSMKQAKR